MIKGEDKKKYQRKYMAKKRGSVPGRGRGRPPKTITGVTVSQVVDCQPALVVNGIVRGVIFTPNKLQTKEQSEVWNRFREGRKD